MVPAPAETKEVSIGYVKKYRDSNAHDEASTVHVQHDWNLPFSRPFSFLLAIVVEIDRSGRHEAIAGDHAVLATREGYYERVRPLRRGNV